MKNWSNEEIMQACMAQLRQDHAGTLMYSQAKDIERHPARKDGEKHGSV